MDIDFTWVLLGLPFAFALGWFASRMDMRQLRIENREDPKAYFKGLNFLLNEQQDQAIDAFVEAVQNDPETSELHFALGNLFRRRGEYDRAVRVHAHLVARADLSRGDHERALQALSLDFMRAGLLDRAEEALRDLEGTAYESQARRTRLMIYERSREWSKALGLAEQIQVTDSVDMRVRRAHYWCEMAEQETSASKRFECLEQAGNVWPQSARVLIALSEAWASSGQHEKALDCLVALWASEPEALLLVAQKMAEFALATRRSEEVRQILEVLYERTHSMDALQALAILASDADVTRKLYVEHLRSRASLVVAAKWIEGEKFEHDEFHPEVQKALDVATKPLKRYRCGACGFEAQHYFWQCPGCQSWDSYAFKRVEEL